MRYYDPAAGRFISRDPIGMWGDPGQRGNAQNYCGNNPVNRVDPMGLDQAFDEFLGKAIVQAEKLGLPTAMLEALKGKDIKLRVGSSPAGSGSSSGGYDGNTGTISIEKWLVDALSAAEAPGLLDEGFSRWKIAWSVFYNEAFHAFVDSDLDWWRGQADLCASPWPLKERFKSVRYYLLEEALSTTISNHIESLIDALTRARLSPEGERAVGGKLKADRAKALDDAFSYEETAGSPEHEYKFGSFVEDESTLEDPIEEDAFGLALDIVHHGRKDAAGRARRVEEAERGYQRNLDPRASDKRRSIP